MLEGAFKAMLITSFAGTVIAGLIVLLRPITKRCFSSSWHYYIWIAVLVVMMLPVKFDVPSIQNKIVFIDEMDVLDVSEGGEAENAQVTASADLGFDWRFTYFVWAGIAVLMAVKKLAGYGMFLRKIKKHSHRAVCPELRHFTDRTITVRKSNIANSPFVTGVFFPQLVLPEGEIAPEQLYNILRHETVHLKRKDMWYKWFAALVKCVHWFNPAVYFISKQIDIECEISCDMAATLGMDNKEMHSYMNTILTLLEYGKKRSALITTGMSGKKKELERRFKMLKSKRTIGKKMIVTSGILAALLAFTGVFASGVLASDKNANTAEGRDKVTADFNSVELVWPCPASDKISRGFDEADKHNGIDIIAPAGEDVISATSGKVISTGYTASQGNYVIVYDGKSIVTLFAALSEISVGEGQNLNQGQVIGKVGNTGMSTGAHLHFEVIVDDVNKNPQLFSYNNTPVSK